MMMMMINEVTAYTKILKQQKKQINMMIKILQN